jgi:hypothetical protein
MAVVTDGRSVTLQQVLIARWKREIKKSPPADRDAFLKSQEAIVALGARQCSELRKGITDAMEGMCKLVPSGAWLEAWWAHNHRLPHLTPDVGRRHAVRTMLSRGLSRIGWDGTPHRRWTPPQAVAVEDILDCMGDAEARFHNYPPSPSAMAIHRMTHYSAAGLRRLGAGGRW